MTTESNASSESGRSRGRKPYPVRHIEECLELPRVINEHGFEGRLRRLSALNHLGRSPSSSVSHMLIANAVRYGLILGGSGTEFLELTHDGEQAINEKPTSNGETLKALFEFSISRFDTFDAAYERLKNNRLPSNEVLEDVFEDVGINRADCGQASSVFNANVRFLGLVREQSGGEYLIPLEQALEELPDGVEPTTETLPVAVPVVTNESLAENQVESTPTRQSVLNTPTVHIDV